MNWNFQLEGGWLPDSETVDSVAGASPVEVGRVVCSTVGAGAVCTRTTGVSPDDVVPESTDAVPSGGPAFLRRRYPGRVAERRRLESAIDDQPVHFPAIQRFTFQQRAGKRLKR